MTEDDLLSFTKAHVQSASITGTLVPVFAASPWTAMTKKVPKPGAAYLIRSFAAGPVHDVAFYNGRNKDGSHWWTLGNVELDPRAITHWASITDPDEEQP